jgi:hypothetical protein
MFCWTAGQNATVEWGLRSPAIVPLCWDMHHWPENYEVKFVTPFLTPLCGRCNTNESWQWETTASAKMLCRLDIPPTEEVTSLWCRLVTLVSNDCHLLRGGPFFCNLCGTSLCSSTHLAGLLSISPRSQSILPLGRLRSDLRRWQL